MIPSLLLVGLVAGAAARLKVSTVVVAVVTALLWGVVVGVASSDTTTFFAGAALALANIAVGLPFGSLLRHVLAQVRPTAR